MSKQTKQLGGIGLILALVASVFGVFIPFAGIVALIGWILTVVAYVKASDEYSEPAIKSNAIKAVVLGIVAVVLFALASGSIVASLAAGFGGYEDVGLGLGGAGIAMLLVGWVLTLIASWFWYKANVSMAEKSSVGLFKTGGLLMFVGAILSVILIGGFISLIGQILLIVAFFSTPESS